MLIHKKYLTSINIRLAIFLFSILLKIKAMVGESRVSDSRGEVERKDDNDKGNFINILVVTITLLFPIVFINNI